MRSCSSSDQNESFKLLSGKIYPHQELDGSKTSLSAWQYRALDHFSSRMVDRQFPCLFGLKAWQAQSTRFLFCQTHREGKYQAFLQGLIEYTDFVKHTPLEDRLLCPLIVFFDDSFYAGAKAQHPEAWDALNWVHAHDPEPWPDTIPLDPDDAQWCFCFNGVQLFINMSSAIHTKMKSRNLGPYLTLVINPRENFDAVASIHTRSGRLIRERIRAKVAAFNDGVVPSELGFYGETENKEWKQYQLSEEGHEQPLYCPFRTHLQSAK